MSHYSGLLVRVNLQDVGNEPASGPHWVSPDIIPYGQGTLTYDRALSTYNQDIGQAITNNLNNNIYVRCKNLANTPMQGNVNLYYADASLFLYPTGWQLMSPTNGNVFTTSQHGDPIRSIPPGEIALVTAPFNLSHLPPDRHYCFIAVVNNDNVKFKIPDSFSSNAAFAAWVLDHPNVAQRNISIHPGSNSRITEYMTFGNANWLPSTFRFSMLGQNIPSDTSWAAYCGDQRLETTPFTDRGFLDKPYNSLYKDGWDHFDLTVPANIGNSTLNQPMTMAFTFSTANGSPFPKDATFTIYYDQIPTERGVSASLFEEEQKLGVIRERRTSRTPEDAQNTPPIYAIPLGSVQIKQGQTS
ncbi:hypothetical protein [Burkholderia ubonensis]|uniref:hypothetical protein n=1 Tax=Burkholderia ubonensis TaxID=101571 RepID=UPI001056AE4E|nr:hypothetical protein [Burkholderia ubonensis]